MLGLLPLQENEKLQNQRVLSNIGPARSRKEALWPRNLWARRGHPLSSASGQHEDAGKIFDETLLWKTLLRKEAPPTAWQEGKTD